MEGTGVEWRGGEGRAGQGRVLDCLGGLSRVGISSRSTRPWNGQPPRITNNEANSVKWDTLSGESINQYKEATDQKLRNVYIPTDALNCTNTSCCDESHRAALNALYNDVMQFMQDASSEVFSDSNVRNIRRGRPGWNDYTNELHEGARVCFIMWRDAGNPR